MNSEKIIKHGFKPMYNFKDAILDLKNSFEKGFKPSDQNWNLKWLLQKKIIVKNDK